MIIQPQNAERLVKLAVWIGGAATTAVGALFASRIRVYEDLRKSHLDELKESVLVPLQNGLVKHFRPLVFHQELLVYVEAGAPTEFRENAKATESQIEQGDVLQGAFPSSLVFGSLDWALLQDARRNHFAKEMAAVQKFVKNFTAPAAECHAWVRRMAQTILTDSGLPDFPNATRPARGPAPYVMHTRLALFVYKRLFGFPAPALTTANANDGVNWTLNGEDATLACGSEGQISRLLEQINKLLVSEKGTAEILRGRINGLGEDFGIMICDLNYATASRVLRKGCDLVPFWRDLLPFS